MFAKYFATLVLQHLSVRVPVLHATCRMQQQKLQQQLRRCGRHYYGWLFGCHCSCQRAVCQLEKAKQIRQIRNTLQAESCCNLYCVACCILKALIAASARAASSAAAVLPSFKSSGVSISSRKGGQPPQPQPEHLHHHQQHLHLSLDAAAAAAFAVAFVFVCSSFGKFP